MTYRVYGYPERDLNPHGPYGPLDFKSSVSTNSTTRANTGCEGKKKAFTKEGLERKTGFEPATPTLARSCSTTELLPHYQVAFF